ncbi:MAG: aconitase X catalytic domain-containing protein [Bacteroidota bacterium]
MLTDYDKALLNGDHGSAARMAMSILVRMLPAFNTDRFLDISAAHIDSSLFQGDATLEYAERLAELGAKVKVPSTLNVGGVDIHGWRDWHVPSDWAGKSHRQMKAYQQMGCIPTWTCAPYQTEHRPEFGQQIAWGESNAIAFANSVIGARTERYPDLLDICAAITGRAPAAGLHLTENRAGQILFKLDDVPASIQADDAFYPVLGHYIGKHAQEGIPVVEGMVVTPTEDQYKALGAAVASSGAVALFHLIGQTPEAPTFEAAFQGNKPMKALVVGRRQLEGAWQELTTTDSARLDMVILGSPHFSLAEFEALRPLLEGKQCHPDVEFLVTTSRGMRQFAERAGHIEALEAFGGKITVDTCILTSPMLSPETEALMTNSAKYAYYSPGLLNTSVVYGRLSDCVTSAVAGKIICDGSLWKKS